MTQQQRWCSLSLLQEDELDVIEPMADAGDVPRLHTLLLGPIPPRSQRLYARSLAASGGWQLHPASAAVWGWLNLANGAFCGSGCELVALAGPAGGVGGPAAAAAAAGPQDRPAQQQPAGAKGEDGHGSAVGAEGQAAATLRGSCLSSLVPAAAAAAAEPAASEAASRGGTGASSQQIAAPVAANRGNRGNAPTWAGLALGVMAKVAASLEPVTAVLLRYAGKADRHRDEALLKDMREVRAGWARASPLWGAMGLRHPHAHVCSAHW